MIKYLDYIPSFFSNSNERIFGHLKAQMHSQAAVSRPTVGPNVRSRMHNAKLGLSTLTTAGIRQGFYNLARHGTLQTVGLVLHAPSEQFELLPVAYVSQVL